MKTNVQVNKSIIFSNFAWFAVNSYLKKSLNFDCRVLECPSKVLDFLILKRVRTLPLIINV